jgi:hypothetical protein
MAEQTIKPLLPVNRSSDVLKKKKNTPPKDKSEPNHGTTRKTPGDNKKGLIDTFV